MEMEKGRSNRRITVCVTQNKQGKKAPILDMGCFLFDLLFPFFPPGDKGKNKVRREGKTQDGGDIKIRQKTEEKINNNNNKIKCNVMRRTAIFNLQNNPIDIKLMERYQP